MHRGVRARCDGMGVAWVCVGIPVSLTFLLLLLLFPETPKNWKALLCSGSVPVCLTYLLKTSRTCLTLSPLPPSFLSHNPSGALTRGVVDVWSCGPGEARGAGEGRHLISVCPGACLEPHLISAPPFLRTDIRLEHPHQPRPKERERDLSRVSFGSGAGVRFQGLNHN